MARVYGWLGCLLALLCVASAGRTAPAARPNLLLITVDDMNWDSAGAFGCRLPGITPAIDRLATEGMRFNQAHVTVAICMPCRATLMTGRYPHRSGALGFNEIRPEVPTLVEQLKAAGYHTGIFAKTPHVVPSRRAAWDRFVEAAQLGAGRDPAAYRLKSTEFFREAKESGKPFFLMANSQHPHRPFIGSAQGQARAAMGGRRAAAGDVPKDVRIIKPEEVTVPGFLPDIPNVRLEVAEYFTSVRQADRIVGEVLAALDEAGQRENTLVVFLSDHGMAFPFAKTNCYLSSTRTPLIVRWPGRVRPGTVDSRHMVSSIDVAPTLLDAGGVAPIPELDGRSFRPVLEGRPQEGHERVYTHINTISSGASYPMRAVNDRRFGYIFNAWSDGKTVFRNESMGGRTWKAMQAAAAADPAVAARTKLFQYRVPEELYDYDADPNALHNLVADPGFRQVLSERRKLMLKQMQATADPQLEAFRELMKRVPFSLIDLNRTSAPSDPCAAAPAGPAAHRRRTVRAARGRP